MKVSLVVAVVSVCLAGCVDTSSPKFQQMSMQKCEGFGYKPGSTEMANCRMQLTVMQEQDNMRRKQNMSRALSEFGDDMNENAQRQADRNAYILAHQQQSVPQLYQRRTINCVSRPGFQTINTTCQ